MSKQIGLRIEDFHPDAMPKTWQNIPFSWPVSSEYIVERDNNDDSKYIFELFAKGKELYNPFHRPEAFLRFARLGDNEPDGIPSNKDILHFTRTYGDIFFGTYGNPSDKTSYEFFCRPRVELSDRFSPDDERSLHYQVFKSDKQIPRSADEAIWWRAAKIKAFRKEVAIAKNALHLYEVLRFPGPHMCDKLKDALRFFHKNAASIGLSFSPIYASVRNSEKIHKKLKALDKSELELFFNSDEFKAMMDGADDILVIFDEETKQFFWRRINDEAATPSSSLHKDIWYNQATTIALRFLKDIVSFKKDNATNGTIKRYSPVREEFVHTRNLLPRYSTPDNLLQAMWNVFFLKVSGQMEYVYMVCEECGRTFYPKNKKDGKELTPAVQIEMIARGEKFRGFKKDRKTCNSCQQKRYYTKAKERSQ